MMFVLAAKFCQTLKLAVATLTVTQINVFFDFSLSKAQVVSRDVSDQPGQEVKAKRLDG